MRVRPPFLKKKIPSILFHTIERINAVARCLKEQEGADRLTHLANMHEAVCYVYYTHLVHKILKGRNGLIVDFGGFYGQVTALLRSLEYNCENYVLYYPRHKDAFQSFDIPFCLNTTTPSRLPYKSNSCLAVISSGVLEHVHETGTTQQEILNEIFRVLVPGGYFFCWNLPRKHALIELLARMQKKSCHDVLFTRRSFEKILAQAGFNMLYHDAHGEILRIWRMRDLLSQLDPWKAFILDYYASKVPPFNFFAHHITAIAQKPQHIEEQRSKAQKAIERNI